VALLKEIVNYRLKSYYPKMKNADMTFLYNNFFLRLSALCLLGIK